MKIQRTKAAAPILLVRFRSSLVAHTATSDERKSRRSL
jgi:hypothetical protein